MLRTALLGGLLVLAFLVGARAEPEIPLVSSIESYLREADRAKRRNLLAEIERASHDEIVAALADVRPHRENFEGSRTFEVKDPGVPETVSYRLALPPGYDPAKRYPLLVAVHGSGANASIEEGLWKTLTDAGGWILACPDGHPERSMAGWGSTDAERNAILAVTRDARCRVSIDPDRVHLAGESRGGHAAWELGIIAPDLWAGLRPVVGGPRIRLRPALENLVPVPVYDVQGAKDDPRLVMAVREACEALRAMGGDVTYVEAPDLGHQEPPGERAKFFAWAETHRRVALPRRFTFTTGQGSPASAFWIRIDRMEGRVPDPRRMLLAVRTRPGATDEEKTRAFIAHALRQLAHVEVEVKTRDRIVIRARNVVKATLFLSREMVDLDRPLTVVWNGRSRRLTTTASVEFLLEQVRNTGDTRRLYEASVTLP